MNFVQRDALNWLNKNSNEIIEYLSNTFGTYNVECLDKNTLYLHLTYFITSHPSMGCLKICNCKELKVFVAKNGAPDGESLYKNSILRSRGYSISILPEKYLGKKPVKTGTELCKKYFSDVE